MLPHFAVKSSSARRTRLTHLRRWNERPAGGMEPRPEIVAGKERDRDGIVGNDYDAHADAITAELPN